MTSLEINRVFSTGDIETLRTTTLGTFQTGSTSAQTWDKEIQNLRSLLGTAKVKSPALTSALDGITGNLYNPDWEEHGAWAGNALGFVAQGIPQQDAMGAEALGLMSENTAMIPQMIADLADCIATAGSSLSLAEYKEQISEVKSNWDGAAIEENLVLFEGKLLGIQACVAYGADPVNMSTGNFVYRYTDLTTRGKSPLTFERTYNGMSRKKGILGRGWHHNWEKKLQDKGEILTLYHEDGREEDFVKEADTDRYINADGGMRIVKIPGCYALADTEGNLEIYDENGNLLQRKDKDGIATDLTYKDGKPVKITHNQSASLKLCYNEKGELIRVSDHTGREVSYAYTGKKLSSVTDPEGNSFTYEYGPNGRIVKILDKRGVCIVKNTYDEYRRITKQTFPDGGVIQIAYMDKHNRVKLTAQNGSSVSYIHDSRFRDKKTIYEDGYEEVNYDENGHVSRRRDKNGNVTHYVHDKAGRLLETKDALGAVTINTYDNTGHPVSIRYADGTKETYAYDDGGRLVSVRTKSGKETHLSYEKDAAYPSIITLADGSIMHFLYDTRGNILSIRYPDGTEDSYVYDELDRVTESMDGNKNRTGYTYDGMDRIKSVKRPDGASRHYTYNPMGEAEKIEDFDGYVMRWEYNAINKPSVYTDKQGRQTVMEYDLMWNISRMTDAEGTVTEYSYDALNRLATVTDPLGRNIHFSYDPNGNRTKVTYPDGSCVQYEYDALNRVIKETDRAGRETKTTYDAMGNVTCITDHAGNATYFEYDSEGLKIKETDRCGAVTAYTYTDLGKTDTITHPGGRVERFHYGLGGVLKRHEKGDGTWEEYTYDKAGNKTETAYPDGSTLNHEYDNLNRIIHTKRDGITEKKYTYDAMGNMTSTEDAAGNVTRYEYYPSGKLRMVTDAMGGRVLYTYNARDELTGILQTMPGEEMTFHTPENISADIQGSHMIHYERDKAGRITAVINALGAKDTYEYDIMDRVISHTNPKGEQTTWEYHTDGQIKKVTGPDERQVSLSYDALARLQKVKEFLGETVFAYDAQGRLVKSTDHTGQNMTYGYNPDGSRAFMQYPDGSKTTYDYDSVGRLTDIKNGEFHIGYAYDDYGRLSVCKRNNGIESLYGYNKAGYLSSLIHRDKDGILEEYGCNYDQRGNKTSVTRTSRDNAYSLTQEYAYDALNRLVEIQENGKTVTRYLYDGYGNRIEEWQYKPDREPAITKRTYDAMNRLLSDGQHTYTYDSLGNLTNVIKDGQPQQSFAYDTTGLLSEAVQDGNVHSYINNALGCRVGSTSETGTATYGIDYSDPYKRITTEKDADGNPRNYLWHDNTLLGISNEGIHILSDLFHSPVRVTDKEGNTQNLYSYDAYGKIRKQKESIPMPFGFTGYLKETGSNLYYTGSREYNPASATFTSKDKYRYMNIQDPQSMNLYAYAKDNPLRYLDYDGHECIEEKDYRKLFADKMALTTCTDGTLGAGLGMNLWLSIYGPDLPMEIGDLEVYFAKNFSPQQLSWWLTLGGTEASYMRLLNLEEHSKQLNSTGDRVVLPENTYSLEEIEAEIEAGINAYWSQDGYFSDGWWRDKGKKEEALNMLLIETLLTGEETGGYDLMQHYTESEPGNPKRYALQMLFQLEPIDGDDEVVLNNIAGACARENIDLVGNGWVIPTQVMQLHAENHEELQVQADMNENRIMSFALNFTPVVGEVKSVVEAAMGQDIFTGEKLSWFERLLGVAAGFVDVANFGKLGKGVKYTDEVLDTAETAGKLGKEVVLENVDQVVIGGKYSAFGEMSEVDGIRYKLWNYEKIHEISIHNPNSNSMTLGKYFDGTIESGSYVAKAELTGDTYFSLGTMWKDISEAYGLSDKEMFYLFNTRALDDAVSQGKTIRFSQNPLEWIGTALGDEWNYLQNKHGYIDLIEIGGYWYAIK